MKRILLNGNWDGACFAADGKQEFAFSGKVPGCVHTDIAGIHIPADIFYRDNADACQWIEDRDWQYSRSFTIETLPKKASLIFEGLDTYADIYLNGKLLASTENMFIRHSFDVSSLLCEGENSLRIYFHSPVRMVEGLEDRPGAFTHERIHTRRVQCTYGWDWVARFVSCGIWRDVYLDLEDGFTVKNAYIYTEAIADRYAQIVVEGEMDHYENGGIVALQIRDPEGKIAYRHSFFCKEPAFKKYITLSDAKLWYPAGYGEQPIYTLEVCGKEYRFGIRTVLIEELPDEVNSPYYNICLRIKDSVSGEIYDKNEEFSGFRLIVNGIPIMCKGANWVPSEPFPSAETEKKITTLLELGKEANLNMLRIWGGGIFEQQHFYSECDRLGILVTQDFLMACGHYPEEKEAFIEQLRYETEFAAYELRNHPCLMWWSGDNENAVLGYDEAEDYQGRTAIHNGIMPILSKLDPKRRFLLSSPYGGKLYASKTVGTTHNTQYIGESIFPYILNNDMLDYKEFFGTFLARFISEEPTTGAVSLPSLRRFMTDEDIFETEDMWLYHTKSNPELSYPLFSVLDTFTKKVLGDYADGKDRFFKLKYTQYEWIRISLENIRRNRGFVNGIVYWMWDDCWPASSGWAFVDYYCQPKASFYSFKRCAGKVLVSIDKTDAYDIYLSNDDLSAKEANLSLSYLKDGKVFPILENMVSIDAAKSAIVHRLAIDAIPEGAVLLCDIEGNGFSDRAFYRNKDLPIIPCKAPAILSRSEDSITLKADSYIHALELEGEYIFTDNYFSMLPGEEKTVQFRPAENAQTTDFTILAYTLK